MQTIQKYLFITLGLLGLLAIANFINIDNPLGYMYMSKFRHNPFLSNSYLKAQLAANDPNVGCSQNTAGGFIIPPSAGIGDNSSDADNTLWGTEGALLISNSASLSATTTAIQNVINQTLNTDNVKVRLAINSFSSSDGGTTYSPSACLPSISQCFIAFNTDEISKLFQANGWSMFPMLSTNPSASSITTTDIDAYVNFVYWFVSKYKTSANIKYLELINDPPRYWPGTDAQLLELQNGVYDRLKTKFPDLIIGTPGFEYWGDLTDTFTTKGLSQVNYFLDPANDARFDAWMFHGYPLNGKNGSAFISYPPTRTATVNPYAGIPGIMQIRQKLDDNGWVDRPIIDAEHIGVIANTATISDSQDNLEAAYMVQELTLKKTLRTADGLRFGLEGILPLKINPRSGSYEGLFGSLFPDTSTTKHVKAVGLLLSKFNEFTYTNHINGQWDNETQAWVEKFDSMNAGNELYIFFKPFKYTANTTISMDGQILAYNLILPQTPASVTLTDINGVVTNLTPNANITLSATNAPQYLEVAY